MTQKILQSRFHWPTMNKDAYEFVQGCERCQRIGSISERDEMPKTRKIMNQYILLVVDYVSKWVEITALPINDTRSLVKFFRKNIFTRFVTPRTLVSGEGSHFCNKKFEIVLAKYNSIRIDKIRHSDWMTHYGRTKWHIKLPEVCPLTSLYIKKITIFQELEKKEYWEIEELDLDLELAN
ncbi:Transposon Ty3-I Gag-Pol polyprotein [Gossypium australe]|uniref:Transposon Ty3-I Gag-Pol polyprotein n=1 Tax=Gossypium australe TaxID=47621 RepID=A0A5B6UGH0_9ROSI|nr:Transposon Ty3-I Gag-Pol polyprotein [Gossypium australe]